MDLSELHPLVAEYVSSDITITSLTKKNKHSKDPLVQGLVRTVSAFHNPELRMSTLEHLSRIPLDGAPPDILIFLMAFWAHLSSDAGRLLESNALLHRAKALVNSRTHPAVVALTISMEADLATRGGHWHRVEKLLKQILQLVPRDSPRRNLWIAWHCELLYLQGLGRSAEAKAHELSMQRCLSENFRPALMAAVKVMDYLERCKTDEAMAQMEIWAPHKETDGFGRRRFNTCSIWLKVLKNEFQPGLLKPPPSNTTDYEFPDWLIAIYALQQHKPQLALQWARAFARREVQSLNALGTEAFTLIRAELACGHLDGASRLMHLRRTQGINHYLDDLFHARLQALKGDFDLAAQHFAAVWRSARKLEAEERLNFELSLACELSPIMLARLAHDSKGAAAAPVVESPATAARNRAPAPSGLVGKSKALKSIQETVRNFGTLDLPVLITGETGTGKEMVARALHVGNRAKHPFIAVNCGAIAESLLESELFGHARGAFTGAERERDGIFAEAGQGTLFLDEIGEISPRLQVSLLRVLENNDIRPVGSSRQRKIACRVIFATNVDLEDAVRRGAFRSDLLYRLRRLEIHLPALRERRDDIPPLVDHFLNLDRAGNERATVTPELERLLVHYPWPGNVRELRNEIERLRLLNSDKAIYGVEDLAPGLMEKFTSSGEVESPKERGHQVISPALERATAGLLPVRAEGSPDRAEDDSVSQFLKSRKLRFRRIEKLKELFRQHKKLTRSEAAHILKISSITAARDLKALEDEKFITRVMPTQSPSTHYFQLVLPAPLN